MAGKNKKTMAPKTFTLAAPSMVYGKNLEKNIEKLSDRLNHIEIVLFHTPDLHNIPDKNTGGRDKTYNTHDKKELKEQQ